MRLATTTNILSISKTGERYIEPCESITRCAKAGFLVFDMSLHNINLDEYILKDDDWKQKIEEIIKTAQNVGAKFSQSHAPAKTILIDPRTESVEDSKRYDTYMRRAIEASEMLGVKWIVMHCMTDLANNCLHKASKKLTIDFYSKYIDFAKKHNVGVAFENMAELPHPLVIRRFGGAYDELCDLVDTINDKNVGICWDFGHANREKYSDQASALLYIGERLKALHVNDNYGIKDHHNVPFVGSVNWKPVMEALKQIKYAGDFSYELKGLTENLPDPLKDSALRFAREVGEFLITL